MSARTVRAVVAVVLTIAASYLVGTLPTAAAVGRREGFDPVAAGSGNPGASNAFRLGGRRAGALVLAGDVAKGAAAAIAGRAVGGPVAGLAAGCAAVVGHVFPVTRSFRGGKGVATAAGVVIVVEPMAAVAGAGVWVAAMVVTRTASVASLLGVLATLATAIAAGRSAGEVLVLSALALLIALRHRGNLARLRAGTERTIERPS